MKTALRITRRDLLRAGAAGIAATALPSFLRFPRGEGLALAQASSGRFFSPGEYATIDAAVETLIPEDIDPGAHLARVVDYIDRFLGAFEIEEGTPFVFAGGPFSDRNPASDPAYCGASEVPANGAQLNDMASPAPLSRRQEITWRARILGTATLGTDADFIRANNLVLGEGDANGDAVGLQHQYRQGIADLDAFARDSFGAETGFTDLDPVRQQLALNLLPNQDFVGLLWEQTVEGMYAPPEYGGNQPPNPDEGATGASGDNRPLGWSYIDYEGDRQPLGYTIFDPVTESYCEIPGHPVSGPDDGPDRAALTQEILDLLPELVLCLRLGSFGICIRR